MAAKKPEIAPYRTSELRKIRQVYDAIPRELPTSNGFDHGFLRWYRIWSVHSRAMPCGWKLARVWSPKTILHFSWTEGS